MNSMIWLPLCGVLLLFCLSTVTSRPTCCLKTSNNKIPIRRVKDYRIQTAGVCPIDAVVLVTVKDREICCDPKSDWIEEFLTLVDQKKQTCNSAAMQNQNAKTGKKKKNGGKRHRQKKQKEQK